MKKMTKAMLMLAVLTMLVSGCAASMTYRCPTGSAIAIFPGTKQTKIMCGVSKAGETINISVPDMEITSEVNLPISIYQMEFIR